MAATQVWTEEKLSQLLVLLKDKTQEQTQQELGLTRDQVQYGLRMLRNAGRADEIPPPKVYRSLWVDNDGRLIELLRTHSVYAVAKELGVTKSCVLGRIYRLRKQGVEFPQEYEDRLKAFHELKKKHGQYAVSRVQRQRAPRKRKEPQAPTEERQTACDPLPLPAEESVELGDSRAADAIAALERNHCRWPYGDPRGAFCFCCAPAHEESSYCKAHDLKAYRHGWKSTPALQRAPQKISLAEHRNRRDW